MQKKMKKWATGKAQENADNGPLKKGKKKSTYAWNDSSVNQIKATARENENSEDFHFVLANVLLLIG